MAVAYGEVGGVELEKEQDGALVAETILESGLDLVPLVLEHAVEQAAADEEESRNSDHVVAAEVDQVFMGFGPHFLQVLLHHRTPRRHNALVVAEQHVIRVQFHHLLQADHQHVGLIQREVEELVEVAGSQLLRVHRVAVPSQRIDHCFLVLAVLNLGEHMLHDVVVEVPAWPTGYLRGQLGT